MHSFTPFQPSWWARNGHAQTILAALLAPRKPVTYIRRRLETPDGDFLDLDFLPFPKKNSAQIVLILHGLEGSSSSFYVLSLLSEVQKCGWHGVAVNMRMCSGEPNRLKTTYHSGKSEDLDFIVRHLIKEDPARSIYLVGYSIGGNIMLKWLGESGENAHVQKAIAVSVPYDLAKSVELLDRGFNREIYTRLLLNRLRLKIRAKEKIFPGLFDPKVSRAQTFTEFDEMVTAPLNGFKNAIDYWTKSSSQNFLHAIKVPTLLIHADDDPFFPGRLLPIKEIQSAPSVELLRTASGGHLGFVSGPWPWKRQPWLENTILAFLKSETVSKK